MRGRTRLNSNVEGSMDNCLHRPSRFCTDLGEF
jgi:hypothetical protein